MLRAFYLTILVCLITTIACQKKAPANKILERESVNSSVTPNTLVVKVTEEFAYHIESDTVATKSSCFAPLDDISSLDIVSVKRLFPYAGRFEERTRKEGLHLWYNIKFAEPSPSGKQTLTKSKLAISAIDGVELVEYSPEVLQDGSASASAPVFAPADYSPPFDDVLLPKQWFYCNNGRLTNSKKGADINIYPVWEQYTTGSSDVIVAVVDSGVEYTHEDLAPNMWVNELELAGIVGIDDDNNGYIDDVYGYNFVDNTDGKIRPEEHGTHVAGVIAAVNDNGLGVSGIAGGNATKGIKGVRIMSCQSLDETDEKGNTPAAIKYGADNGAVISQNSWSLGETIDTPQHYKDAIDYFIKYAGLDENGNQVGPLKGGIVIFASGNSKGEVRAPANYPPCIAVTSISADYKRAYYSAYGEGADLAAPGGDIKYNNHPIISTVLNNRYGSKQGTSMAAPQVSGVAALLVSYLGKQKGLTPNEVTERLIKCVTPIQHHNPNEYLGTGLLNAYSAFQGNLPPEQIKQFPNILINATSASAEKTTIYLGEYFSDADPLKYTVEIIGADGTVAVNVVNAELRDDILTLVPVGFGAVDVSISASDGANPSISTEFKLIVRDNSHPDEDIIPVDIFPNPVTDFLTVRVAQCSDVEVEIHNIQGNLVSQKDGETDPFNPLIFDFTHLSAGSYIVTITSEDKKIQKPIVKL